MSFDLTIDKVTNLDKSLNGTTVFVEWRRGSHKNTGITKRALVTKLEANWHEAVTISCNLYKDTKKDKFDEKVLTLTLKEVCGSFASAGSH